MHNENTNFLHIDKNIGHTNIQVLVHTFKIAWTKCLLRVFHTQLVVYKGGMVY